MNKFIIYIALLIFLLNETSILYCNSFLNDYNIKNKKNTLTSENPRTKDSIALVALYNSTDGKNWKNKSGWLQEIPLEEWWGVAEIENDRVTKIILNNNNLTGYLPYQMSDLTELIHLELQDNKLSEGLSHLKGLGNLLRKGYVDISNNKFDFKDFEDLQIDKNIKYFPQKSFGKGGSSTYPLGGTFKLVPGCDHIYNNKYKWYKWLNESNQILIQEDSMLTISDLNENDSGNYYCKVTNSKYPECTLVSEKFTINVDVNALKLISPSENEVINTLKPIFEWEKVSGAYIYDIVLDNIDPKKFKKYSSRNTIFEMQEELENGETYNWYVKAYNDTLIKRSQTWKFKIKSDDKINIKVTSDKNYVCPGESFTLSVSVFNGSGNFKYEWYKKLDSTDEYLGEGSSIIVRDTNYYENDHINKYYVKLINNNNVTITSSNEITIIVKSHKLPKLKNRPEFPKVSINKNSNDSIILESEGLPDYTYFWLDFKKNQIGNQNKINIGKLDTGNHTYYLKNKNNISGCESYNALEININVSNSILQINGKRHFEVCEGDEIDIGDDIELKLDNIVQDINDYEYEWNSEDTNSDINLLDKTNTRNVRFKGKKLPNKIDETYKYKLTIRNKKNNNIKNEFIVEIRNFYKPVPKVKETTIVVDYDSTATIELEDYNQNWTYYLFDNNGMEDKFTSGKFITQPLNKDAVFYVKAERRINNEISCLTPEKETIKVEVKVKLKDITIKINDIEKDSVKIELCKGNNDTTLNINVSGGSGNFTIKVKPMNDDYVELIKDNNNRKIKVTPKDTVRNKDYEIIITDTDTKIEKKIRLFLFVYPKPKEFNIGIKKIIISENEYKYEFSIENPEDEVVYYFESEKNEQNTDGILKWSSTGSKTVKITAKNKNYNTCQIEKSIPVKIPSSIYMILNKTKVEPGDKIILTIKPTLPEDFSETIKISYSKYELFNKDQKIDKESAYIEMEIKGETEEVKEFLVLVGNSNDVTINAVTQTSEIPITPITLKIKPVNIAGKEFQLRLRNKSIKIDIIPNPVTNKASIKITNSKIGNVILKILNSIGSTIETKKIEIFNSKEQEVVLDLSNYRSGVYYIVLISNEDVIIENIVLFN